MKLFYFSLTVVAFILTPTIAAADTETKFSKTFGEVFPLLDETVDLVDQHRDLPRSSWISRDQKSNNADIDELLVEAVGALQLESIVNYRDEITNTRELIRKAQNDIARYRRLKIQAPSKSVLGIDSLPFYVTRDGYDARIETEQENIKKYQKRLKTLKSDFREELETIGLSIPADEFDFLLETVTGDDYVNMQIAFKGISAMTAQLETLTEQTGEDIETARRYYGMYVVLLKILDKTQDMFVEDIDSKHIPKITELIEAAHVNISEAENAIKNGGDPAILTQNIDSNQLTIEALILYRTFLDEQKEAVLELNGQLARDLLTATNTYHTVSLAREVTSLLRTGIKRFEAVKALEVPHMLNFENRAVREEFMKLTERMRLD